MKKLVSCALLALAFGQPAAAEDRRLCALLPWVAEAFAAPDDGVALAAMVPRHLGLPVLAGAQDLGNPHAPNLEVLAAARCELLVADGRIHRALQPSLEGIAGSLLWLDGSSVETTFQSLEQVGSRLGAQKAVEAQVAKARQRLAELKGRQGNAEVLALFGAPGAWRVMTRQTWLGDLLASLGFVNLGDTESLPRLMPGFAALSDEVLLGLKPRMVLLVAHGDPDAVMQGFKREAVERPAFRTFADKAHALDPELFGSNPGLEFPTLAEHLLKILGEAPAGTASLAAAPAPVGRAN